MAAPMSSLPKCCLFINFLIVLSFAQRKDIFSTKTAYSWVTNLDETVTENELIITDYGVRRCFAVNIQALLRHGARFPGYKDIRKMTELHKKLKLAVKKETYPFLQTWENDFPESEEKQLVDEGEDEQFGLGQRFGKRLRALFRENVDHVHFFTSSKDRSIDSALAFFEGFSEEILHEASDDLKHETKEQLLRFHTLCKTFVDAVENNRTHMKYHKQFKSRPEMQNVANNVKTRLGLEHIDIEAGDLKLIYFWCTFEMIILGKDDWCQLLTDEEKEVIEYHNDMKQYWKKAYGHPVIGAMACPLVNTMFKQLSNAADINVNSQDPDGDVGSFYFGHAETLAPLYAALGLFNDSQPLLDTNYAEMKDRMFKSSRILPFSANLAIILYKCDHPESAASSVHDFFVKFFVNEQPIKIPVCNDYMCKFTDVKEAYVHHIEGCDFDKVCDVQKHDEL